MLIGHQKQWNFLRKAAETKRFSHAYLFCGQEKLGKKTLALEWISFLFGQDVQNLTNHPDVVFIEPQVKEIQISQIRDLIWRLSLKPSLAPLKVAIIDNAHLMNQEAQTSLLKTLEEPRGEALLILISDKAQYLFPTILSRVQIIKFNSVKKEEIKNYLLGQGVSEKETEEISEIALGRPGVALDLSSGKEKLENFTQRITELNKISNSPFYLRFQYAKNLAEDLESIKDILDIWLNYFRSILLSRFSPSFDETKREVKRDLSLSTPSPAKRGEGGEGDEVLFSKYPTTKIKNIINRIQTTKFLLSNTNINSRLALETLMLEINL